MGLYDKYARLAGERLQFSDNGLTPFGTCIDEVYSATEGRIGNKKVILAGTNNYLGLTFNHDAISEGQAALAAQGTGTTGSRMANGSYAPHLALEKEIAEFFNRPTAIVFSTGYTANLGVISALADHNAVVLLDADSHASIYDACSLGGAEIIRFRHNDAKDLERRMVRLGERAKEDGLRIWRELISLGVYVNLILPPAAPAGITLLRCSVNAAHSREQIDAIIQAFATLKQ